MQTDNNIKAELLNNFFTSVFTNENATQDIMPNFELRTDQTLSDIDITETKVHKGPVTIRRKIYPKIMKFQSTSFL